MSALTVSATELDGLYVVNLDIHSDSRGSFREVYQLAKLSKLKLPYLGPVQWNISENNRKGIIRGVHAEPWDKYIHCITGRAWAVIVDLRPVSPTFGQHRTFELDQTRALFVSTGLGNAYQVVEAPCVYGYLVNSHWRSGQTYPSVVYNDPDLDIQWPLPVGPDDVSDKDRQNPMLRQLWPDKFPE